VENIKDPIVKNFWTKEFANFNDRYRQEAISPILNKIGQFLSTDLVRNIIGQKNSTIDFREIMDTKKILIVNLSKGRLGEDNSNLLGSLIVTKLQLAALSRVDIPEKDREDFYLYVDEFQNFTTDSFGTILSEARKYKLNLVLAHQYIAQLSESGNDKVKNAIFGNIGTLISFRVGSDDAHALSKEFAPVFEPQDLISLDRTKIALTLSIHDKKSTSFLASTLPPIFDKLNGRIQVNTDFSRQKYGLAKHIVVDDIAKVMSQNYGVNAVVKNSKKSKKATLQSLLKDSQKNDPEIDIKLPMVPSTPLNIPQNDKVTGSLEALKKARDKVSSARYGSRLVLGNTQNPSIDDEKTFEIP
jgi:hypothetical protein